MDNQGSAVLTDLTNQIRVVAGLRETSRKATELVTNSLDEWEKENKTIIELKDKAKSDVAEAEEYLRELTKEAYDETGDKKPAEGVGIRIVTEYDYDPDKAYEWALDHKLALMLDKKAFESFIKTTKLEFVTSKDVVTATISKELPNE